MRWIGNSHRGLWRIALATSLAVSAGTLIAAEPPGTVSPGDPGRSTRIEARCPTFLWGGTEAIDYELIVLQIGDQGEESGPVLRVQISGPASGWTPELERCLQRGQRYAWSLRSLGDPPSAWSEPRLFEVAGGPTEEEFQYALGIVRDYLADHRGYDSPEQRPAVVEEGPDGSAPPAPSEAGASEPEPISLNLAATASVEGEVRSVDSLGQPRLWGRGRPDTEIFGDPSKFGGACLKGTTFFGLSRTAVDWGSAADACPEGTWVCRFGELGPCDTNRPDGVQSDYMGCDGTLLDFPDDQHEGWIADAASNSKVSGTTYMETYTTLSNQRTCRAYPVWCCWPLSVNIFP